MARIVPQISKVINIQLDVSQISLVIWVGSDLLCIVRQQGMWCSPVPLSMQG